MDGRKGEFRGAASDYPGKGTSVNNSGTTVTTVTPNRDLREEIRG